jgi:hypothetical protein
VPPRFKLLKEVASPHVVIDNYCVLLNIGHHETELRLLRHFQQL